MDLYDKISELGKRRGFFFPSFEIYGGVSGFFDYGPLGSLLKHNVENKWRNMFVKREGMVEIESTIIMPKAVFEGSGHLSHFSDIMTKCPKCNRHYRAESLFEKHSLEASGGIQLELFDRLIKEHKLTCPECGGTLDKYESFNLMFRVDIGPYGSSITGYGRPEAGQGQFIDFKRIYSIERGRLPLGIAQVGRCVRNEIAPRKGPIRLREFTIIDYEIFIDPEDTAYPRIELVNDFELRILPVSEQLKKTGKIHDITVGEALKKGVIQNEVQAYFMALAVKFMWELGVPLNNQRLREQLPDEKAHYSQQTFDQEIWFERWGWTEISGHSYRADYDLRGHMAYSGVDLRVFKPFDEPREIVEVNLKPKTTIDADFGEDAPRVKNLLLKCDPKIVEREIEKKDYYELPGQPFTIVTKKHVEFQRTRKEANGRYFIPHVVEPSFGVDRIVYAVLEYSYAEKKKRSLLQLPRDLAPIKVAVFPLVSKDGLPEVARKIYDLLIDEGFVVEYGDSGSIGRRYARADEVGIPVCVTIDYSTLEDKSVTLRDINTWKQVRVKFTILPELLRRYLIKKIEFDQLVESY